LPVLTAFSDKCLPVAEVNTIDILHGEGGGFHL